MTHAKSNPPEPGDTSLEAAFRDGKDAVRAMLSGVDRQGAPAHSQAGPPKRKRGRPRKLPATIPATPEPKLNAVTHGLTSSAVVLPGIESEDEWLAFKAGIVEDLDPGGAVERALVERIATLFWRLGRVPRFEVSAITSAIEGVGYDYDRAWGFAKGSLKQAREWRDKSERRLQILRDLPALPVGTYIDAEDADAIINLIGADIELPPELTDYAADDSAANATLLRLAVKTAAEAQERSPETLLADAIAEAERELQRHLDDVDFAESTQARMRGERQSPPESFIRTAGRYEAQLDRALHRAMTQLETLKAARHGRPIPLHRVHVEH